MQVLKIIIFIFVIYIVLAAAPAFISFRMIFSPKKKGKYKVAEPAESCYEKHGRKVTEAVDFLNTLPSEDVNILCDDGVRLYGIYYDGGFKNTGIFFHGYKANPLSHFAVQAEVLYKMGFNVLLVYQRAHGKSEGKYTTLGLKEQYDLLSWINWAENKNISKILIYGMSMGATAATYASDKMTGSIVKGIVSDCGFSSVYEQIKLDCKRIHLPWQLLLPLIQLLAKVVIKIDIKTSVRLHLKKAVIPMLFIHGKNDETVPFSQAVKNYNACAAPKDKLFIEDAGHTEAFLEGGEEALRKFKEWIENIF